MSEPFRLVLGTNNQKKRDELASMLRGVPIDLLILDDFDNPLEVEETGTTFDANAALKACEQAKHLGEWVVADDSGLSVEALDGQPGVLSSRFAGPEATDSENNAKLVDAMRAIPVDQRAASFICHVTLSDPQGNGRIDVEGNCRGRIVLEPRGTAGFGYDPHFELIEYRKTLAELGDPVKAILSHRGRAMRQFLVHFRKLLDKLNQERATGAATSGR